MPIPELVAMAALAAASASDASEPPEPVRWWAVVWYSAARDVALNERDGHPPIIRWPRTGIFEEETTVLELQADPRSTATDFELPLMLWFYRTAIPGWVEAMAKYRRRKPPWWVREQIQQAGPQPAFEETAEELLFSPRHDWPDFPWFRWYGVVRGGELAWVEDEGVFHRGTKKDVVKLLMGHQHWLVLLRYEAEFEADDQTWFEKVTGTHDPEDAITKAIAQWETRESLPEDEPTERVLAKAVFLGGSGMTAPR
jgi:hypothetical protein